MELGLSIALEDFSAICYVEQDRAAVEILKNRMRDGSIHRAPIWDDLKTFDGRPWRGLVDIVSAGYPCQFASGAARGRNVGEWLWPWVRKAILETRPPYVFTENVLRDDRAIRSLKRLGYRVRTLEVSAADVGAPHIRPRVFMLGRDPNQEGKPDLAIHDEASWVPEPLYFDPGPWYKPDGDISLADGVAPGVGRARVCGNGVVPLAAAYALRSLANQT